MLKMEMEMDMHLVNTPRTAFFELSSGIFHLYRSHANFVAFIRVIYNNDIEFRCHLMF